MQVVDSVREINVSLRGPSFSKWVFEVVLGILRNEFGGFVFALLASVRLMDGDIVPECTG